MIYLQSAGTCKPKDWTFALTHSDLRSRFPATCFKLMLENRTFLQGTDELQVRLIATGETEVPYMLSYTTSMIFTWDGCPKKKKKKD